MKLTIRILTGCFLFISLFAQGFASENLFYILRDSSAAEINILKSHFNSINIVVSQAYYVNQNGELQGHANFALLNFLKTHPLKLMAMVTNLGFDPHTVEKFLNNAKAQQRAIRTLLQESLKNHYYGIQFDFEMVPLKDKDALTHFYKIAAQELHKKNLVVSFAIAPLVSNKQNSTFLKRSFLIWQGAYDLKALGEYSDFVSVMAYNQHTEGTIPGPTACFPWVEQVVKYIAQFIPPQKISLGIASYSSYWTMKANTHFPGKFYIRAAEISYKKVNYLLKKYHTKLHWDEMSKNNYTAYEHNWLNEYIFVEDAKSFKFKVALVKRYNLRGISVFRVGIEDPKIWEFV